MGCRCVPVAAVESQLLLPGLADGDVRRSIALRQPIWTTPNDDPGLLQSQGRDLHSLIVQVILRKIYDMSQDDGRAPIPHPKSLYCSSKSCPTFALLSAAAHRVLPLST